MKTTTTLLTGLILLFTGLSAYADPILSPGDAIVGGQMDGDNIAFTVGQAGSGFGTNQWPSNEAPENLINGVGQKYLNFGIIDTGVIITPLFGSSIVDMLTLWTANDSPDRDPTSYELWGTNSDISGNSIPVSIFSLISSGSVALPTSRNNNGTSPLLDANSWSVSFANSSAYTSYMLIFPRVNGSNCCAQLAEAQLYGAAPVPEPATLALLGIGLLGMGLSRRRKKI